LPARTTTVLRLTLSRTVTEPRTTRVNVPAQLSCTSHFVPRTVAELYVPLVRKEPLPSPHRWRLRFLVVAALGPPPRHEASAR
jgi:hypothetical protein